MDIFSGNNLNINQPIYFDKIGNGPNLVSNNTMNEIGSLLQYKGGANDNLSDIKVNDGVSNFYANYIQPNIFFIILAVLFLLFLYWRYETKNNTDLFEDYQNNKKRKSKKQKKIEKKIRKIEDLIETIESGSNDSIKKDQGNFVANFNPSVPVSAQNSYTNFMDDHVPIITNGNRVTYRQFYNDPEPDYEYLPIMRNKINKNDTYTGLYNEYNNFVDQDYNNPYDWEKNYNETTYNAIEYATRKNRESLQLMNEYVDNTNNQIMKNIM